MTTLSFKTVLKSASFVIVGIIAAVLVSNTLRVPVSGPTTTYHIAFTDAEGLVEGNPVTMSGVRIGRVSSVRFAPQADGTSLADVEVEIQRDRELPQQIHAAIRYGDMLGARYIALSEGRPGQPGRNGTTIPVDATSPPVNLTALMNGFQPLFSALDPNRSTNSPAASSTPSKAATDRFSCCCARSARWAPTCPPTARSSPGSSPT